MYFQALDSCQAIAMPHLKTKANKKLNRMIMMCDNVYIYVDQYFHQNLIGERCTI